MSKAETDQLWVDVEGTGAPVVLVHGLGGTATVFEPVTERLRDAPTVLRFDLRGHGRSGRSTESSVGAWADDLDRLLDTFPTASADFVGVGLGALILEHFVATRPGRVGRMVLVNPLHGLAEHHRTRYRELAELVRENGLQVLLDRADEEFGGSPETAPAILRALRRELIFAQDPEEYAAACDAIAATHTTDLGLTTVPTLVLVGTDSSESLASAAAVGRGLATSKVVELEGLADWPTIEQPSRVANCIASFLLDDSVDGAAA